MMWSAKNPSSGRCGTRSRPETCARRTSSPARAAPARPRSPGSSPRRSTARKARRPTPDGTCHACLAIANGTSLDVVEMDAASQRGIDDIREIRERVVLQPVEGRYKVYILDEAHQLTDAALNALLKLIEEPPPHLVFVFCTTELQKMLPTVRSRCQTFVFSRPRLPEIVRCLKARRRGRGDRGARCRARADRALRARELPRRGLDARPALRRDRGQGHRAGRAPAARRRRGGGAVPALRPRRRPRHRRRAHLRRGARRPGPGPRPARHRPARAPAAPHARPAPGRGARLAAASPRRRASGCARRRTSSARRRCCGSATCSRSPSTTCARAAIRACRSSSRSSRSRGPAADLSRESLAYRLEQLEQRVATPQPAPVAGARPRGGSPKRRRRPSGRRAEPPSLELEQLQEAWQRAVAARGRAALDPGRLDAPRGAPLAARRRPAHGRVPGEPPLPPAARRGAEERDAPRATRSTRSPAGKLALDFAVGETARRTPEEDEEPAERGRARRAHQGDVRRARGGRVSGSEWTAWT